MRLARDVGAAPLNLVELCPHGGALFDEHRLALELRGELRRPHGQRRQSVDQPANHDVTRGVVVDRQTGQLTRDHHVSFVLRDEIRLNRGQRPQSRLNLDDSPLELCRRIRQLAPALAERRDLRRDGRELVDASAKILAVHRDRLDLFVEHVEHVAKVRAERASADRAGAALAQFDDLIALGADVLQLIDERMALRLRFLLVAYPVGLRGLEGSLRLIERLAGLLERRRDLGLERRRDFDLRCPLAQLRDLLGERGDGLGQCSLAAGLGGAPVELLDLGLERRKRRQLPRDSIQLGARGRRIAQLAVDPRDLALDGRQLAVGDARFGGERLRALAIALQRFPARRDLFDGAARRRSSNAGIVRLARALGDARLRVGERALNDVGVRHSGAQPRRLGDERLPAFARQVLRRSQPLVAEHAREELAAFGRAHRGHHAEFFLPGEIGMEELVAVHPEPAREHVGDGGDRGRDRR